MKPNFFLRHQQLSIVSFILLFVLIGFTPLKIFALIAAVLIGGLILVKYIRSIGVITAVLVSFLLLTCFQQVMGVLFWLLHTPFAIEWYIAIILSCELAYFVVVKERIKISDFLRSDRLELISVLIATLSIAVLGFGMLRTGPTDVQMTRFITRGFDSSTHLSLIMSVYKNQGYIYGPPENVHDRLVYQTLTSYPQGWHLVTSSVWKAIDGNLSFVNTIKLETFFFITALFWYSLLIFFATRITAEVASRIAKVKMTPLYLLSCLGAISFLLQASTTISLVRYGFVNYIALITYLLCIILLTFLMYERRVSLRAYIVAGVLLSTGSAFTWLLAAPIGYTIIGIALGMNIEKRIDTRKYVLVWKKYIATILVVLLLMSATLVQTYLQVAFSTIPDNISADTVIWSTNRLLITILLCSVLTFILLSEHSRSFKNLKRALITVVLGSLLVPGLIYLYLFLSSGKIGYYSEKINAIPIIILVCAAGGVGLGLLWNLRKRIGEPFIYSIVTLLAVSTPLALGLDLKELKFAVGKDWTTSEITARQINSLLRDGKSGKNNVFIVKELNYEEDVISTHFMNVVSRKETKCSSSIGWNQIIRSNSVLANEIRHCAQADPNVAYTVIASKMNYKFWQKEFASVKNIDILVED